MIQPGWTPRGTSLLRTHSDTDANQLSIKGTPDNDIPRGVFNLGRIFRSINSTLASKGVILAIALLLGPTSVLFSVLKTPQMVHAATTGTSKTLNFQARLLTNTGSIVPDGFYNIQFKIYDAPSAGTLLWTDTRIDTNGVTAGNDFRIRVTNGYFSVNLGDSDPAVGGTAFSGIDWSQQLWMTMNVGGTTQTATPTYDGEMSPRITLTAVPLAFLANNVNSGNTAAASTNSANTILQSGNATGATSNSGTVTLQSGNASSGNSGNISIDAGTASSTKGTISVGTANASNLILGRSGLTTLNNGSLTVAETLTANGTGTGLAVANNATVGGTLTVIGATTHSDSVLGANTATATTGTSSGTGGTNVTSITLAAAGSFANGDIILVHNTGGSGQDYYTRIIAGGGTTTITIDPAISYGTNAGYTGNAAITKYNIQNVGAASTGTTFADSARFFQGYFLGGIRTGSGSTVFSDQNISSSQALYLNTAGTTRLTVSNTGNVGIGNSNNTYKLDVTGDINTSTGFRIGGTAGVAAVTCSGGTPNYTPTAVAGGIITAGSCTANGSFSGSGAANQVAYFTGSTALASSALYTYDGSHLGVGTVAPTSLLDVAQPTTGVGTVSNAASGTTVTGVGTQFTNTFKVGDTITIGGQTVAISAIASDTSMTTAGITSANSNVAYTLTGGTRFSVKGNGNVGIGTTAPNRQLTVMQATGTFNSTVNLVNADSTVGTGGGILFSMNNASAVESTYGGFSVKIATNTAGSHTGNLALRVANAGVLTDVLSITGTASTFTGTVGVGAAPVTGRSLSVNGILSTTAGNRLQLVDSGSTNLWNIDNSGGTLRLFREDYSATGAGANGAVKLTISNAGYASFTGDATIDNAFVGNQNACGGYAGFSYALASPNCTNYAIIQNSSGATFVNSASGQSLGLRVGNADQLTLSAGAATFSGTLTVNSSFQSGSGNGLTLITNPGGGIGSRLQMTGPSANQSMYVENIGGSIRFVNNAYSAQLLAVDQSGNLNINGSLTQAGSSISLTNTNTQFYGDGSNTASRGSNFYIQSAGGGSTYAIIGSSSNFYGSINMNGNDVTANNLTSTNLIAQNSYYTSTAVQTAGSVCRGSANGFGWIIIGNCASLTKYKDNITTLPYGLDTLNLLHPVQYKWNVGDMSWDTGFTAEDVQAVAPIFNEYENGVLSGVKYDHITSLIVNAVQQLDKKVEVIKAGNFSGNLSVAGDASIKGSLTVQGDATLTKLIVTGDTILQKLTVNGKIITAGAAPAVALGMAAGDSHTAAGVLTGNDTAGTFSVTTGSTGTVANQVLGSVIFTSAYDKAPIITVTPTSVDAASIRYYLIKTATGWSIQVVDAPVAGKTYSFDYHVIQ